MRQAVSIATAAVVMLCAALPWSAVAQDKDAAGAGKAKTSEDAKDADKPTVYMLVSAAEIERFPKSFTDKHIQVVDYFGSRLSRPPGSLRTHKITRKTHTAFFTHPGTGSNMLCVVSRDDEEAVAVLDTLNEESPIYIQGRVGPVIDTPKGRKPLFIVDRMVRGHSPPPPRKTEKKPVVVVIEYAPGTTTAPRLYRRYKIPKPGKRYVIPDPYDPKKKIFITLEY